MSVLILAQDLDASVDAVLTAVQQRGQVVHRVNTAWFPSSLAISARLDGSRWCGVLRTPHRVVDLDEVHAVWYRSPGAYEFPASLSGPERAYANLEAKYGLGGVLSSLPVRWVSHPARMADAAYKPVQLTTAARCGLSVPETLLTTDAADVRRFVAAGPTITKVVGSNSMDEQGVQKLCFTRRISEADIADLSGITTTTHLFQRWVPKQHEARVIVIGDHITTVAIHADSAAARVDWRADYDALRYEVIDLPPDVQAGIRALVRRLDLRYGALDFVITPEGQWVFLEINPGGQYGWIEAATGAPLTDQMADLLTEGGHP